MKLRILTPAEVAFEEDVVHVTADDPTGSLGVRAGHAAMVTKLVPGIVIARTNGGETYVAVNGGVMVVDGETVEIVSRQAIVSRDLAHLEGTVLEEFEKNEADDKTNHAAFEKMRIRFLRGMVEFDRAGVS